MIPLCYYRRLPATGVSIFYLRLAWVAGPMRRLLAGGVWSLRLESLSLRVSNCRLRPTLAIDLRTCLSNNLTMLRYSAVHHEGPTYASFSPFIPKLDARPTCSLREPDPYSPIVLTGPEDSSFLGPRGVLAPFVRQGRQVLVLWMPPEAASVLPPEQSPGLYQVRSPTHLTPRSRLPSSR